MKITVEHNGHPRVVIPELGADDTVTILVDGRPFAGLMLNRRNRSAVLGHWPDGEHWNSLLARYEETPIGDWLDVGTPDPEEGQPW